MCSLKSRVPVRDKALPRCTGGEVSPKRVDASSSSFPSLQTGRPSSGGQEGLHYTAQKANWELTTPPSV